VAFNIYNLEKVQHSGDTVYASRMGVHFASARYSSYSMLFPHGTRSRRSQLLTELAHPIYAPRFFRAKCYVDVRAKCRYRRRKREVGLIACFDLRSRSCRVKVAKTRVDSDSRANVRFKERKNLLQDNIALSIIALSLERGSCKINLVSLKILKISLSRILSHFRSEDGTLRENFSYTQTY